ncbi:MAG: D-2-hydroxyacid dehydrogenase [Alphaproteobacteria bacterium]|nr:D-2-hydroxyacid dehydrogenase [Alphaproteobacteria bacterium]
MTSLKIVCLERATLAPEITIRRPSFAHDWTDHDRTRPDQVAERLAGAAIAVVNKVRVSEDALAKLPDLKLIAVAATGTDNVDLAACARRGIVVSNIRGYAVNTVPEHTFALILALRRGVVGYRADVARGEWQKAQQFCFFAHPISDLRGSRLGIIGGGAIGQAVAALGRAFGMDVVFSTQKGGPDRPHYVSFEQVIETADVITLHCPLTASTRGMIGRDVLRRMKRTAIIVNTARGPLIDDAALTEALRGGWIGGAAIDVTMPEPPPPDHPMMKLLDLPNFILTPHVAWASRQAMQTLADQLIDNIEAFVAGAPRNVVAAG